MQSVHGSKTNAQGSLSICSGIKMYASIHIL